MPEKRSDLVQEEETVRNFRITKGEETDRNFRDFRENSEDIQEWKGKEETEEQEKLEISGSYQKSSVRRLVKMLFFLLVFLVTVIGGTWFLYGAEILAQFWIYEVSVGGILAVILILSHFILEKVGKNGKLKAEEVETEDPWRVFYETRKSRRRPMIFAIIKTRKSGYARHKYLTKDTGQSRKYKRNRRISDHAPYAEREAGPYTCVCEA